MTQTIPSVALVVPTLNGGRLWREWLTRFGEQSIRPEKLLVIDSSSEDDTVELSKAAGFHVISISPKEFDHGGTRQLGFDTVEPAKSIIFMTQDALLASPDSLAKLLEALDDSRVAVAYGRQIPRPSADPIEAHARLFNYPDCSHRRSIADMHRLGIKAAFLSNSFAAYRCAAVKKVGGFPSRLIVGEDSYVATRLLADGWEVAYCAEAKVCHSHGYTLPQYFRRYFDMGVFHARERWICEMVGSSSGEGLRFVESELAFLARRAPLLIPRSLSYTAVKLLGYKLGLNEKLLPPWLKPHMSSARSFWVNDANPLTSKSTFV